MNLRDEFDSIMAKYGHAVYLQRVTNPFEGNEKLTYSTTLEKWMVRSMNPFTSGGLPGLVQEQPEGLEFPAEMVFWFRWNVNPGPGDRIYENLPGYPNNQVIYTIDYADAKRGDGGRIEFWAIGATRISPQ